MPRLSPERSQEKRSRQEIIQAKAEKLSADRRNNLDREGAAAYLQQWRELGVRIRDENDPSKQLNGKQMREIVKLFLAAEKIKALIFFSMEDSPTWQDNLKRITKESSVDLHTDFWEWPVDLAEEVHYEFNQRERFWRLPLSD